MTDSCLATRSVPLFCLSSSCHLHLACCSCYLGLEGFRIASPILCPCVRRVPHRDISDHGLLGAAHPIRRHSCGAANTRPGHSQCARHSLSPDFIGCAYYEVLVTKTGERTNIRERGSSLSCAGPAPDVRFNWRAIGQPQDSGPISENEHQQSIDTFKTIRVYLHLGCCTGARVTRVACLSVVPTAHAGKTCAHGMRPC